MRDIEPSECLFIARGSSDIHDGEGAPSPGALRESGTASSAVQYPGGDREERERGGETAARAG